MVIVTAMAAVLTPLTPPLVAVMFVMVLVGFGGGWTAVWRLPAIVRLVEVSDFGVGTKMVAVLTTKGGG